MFADEIAARLVTAGIGVLGTTLFIGSKAVLPAGAGPLTTIVETGGSGSTYVQNQAAAATKRPTAQVTCRATSYAAARTKAAAALAALDGVWNTTLSGTFYLKVTARQQPTDIGLDDAGRVILAFNIDAETL